MNRFESSGRSLIATMLSWLTVLLVGAVVVEILVTEFVRLVTILAPWVVLTIVIAVSGFAIVAVLRRRSYGY